MTFQYMNPGGEANHSHQDNLRLVQFLLDFHDSVGLPRVLVLLEVDIDLGERYRSWIRKGWRLDFGCEVVQHLREQ